MFVSARGRKVPARWVSSTVTGEVITFTVPGVPVRLRLLTVISNARTPLLSGASPIFTVIAADLPLDNIGVLLLPPQAEINSVLKTTAENSAVQNKFDVLNFTDSSKLSF